MYGGATGGLSMCSVGNRSRDNICAAPLADGLPHGNNPRSIGVASVRLEVVVLGSNTHRAADRNHVASSHAQMIVTWRRIRLITRQIGFRGS